jgi:Skp family chaperone for outer membrane proteins
VRCASSRIVLLIPIGIGWEWSLNRLSTSFLLVASAILQMVIAAEINAPNEIQSITSLAAKAFANALESERRKDSRFLASSRHHLESLEDALHTPVEDLT